MNLQAALRWLYNISKLNLFSRPYFLSVFVIITSVSASFIKSFCHSFTCSEFTNLTHLQTTQLFHCYECAGAPGEAAKSVTSNRAEGRNPKLTSMSSWTRLQARLEEDKARQHRGTVSLFSHRLRLVCSPCNALGLHEQPSHLWPCWFPSPSW